jgi:hypothetical protein
MNLTNRDKQTAEKQISEVAENKEDECNNKDMVDSEGKTQRYMTEKEREIALNKLEYWSMEDISTPSEIKDISDGTLTCLATHKVISEETIDKLEDAAKGDREILQDEVFTTNKPKDMAEKLTINPAAAEFKPEVFTGKEPELAENWWKKLKEYLRLAEVDKGLFCSLTRLLLREEAEKWFNFLPEVTQKQFILLERAFKQQYIRPQAARLTKLAEIRARVQRQNESLRGFLVDIGSKLKAIGYRRELWLDLVYPTLRPQQQSAILNFGIEEIKTFDDLLESAEKIEMIANALGSREQGTDTLRNVHTDGALQDQMAQFEKKLTHIALMQAEKEEIEKAESKVVNTVQHSAEEDSEHKNRMQQHCKNCTCNQNYGARAKRPYNGNRNAKGQGHQGRSTWKNMRSTKCFYCKKYGHVKRNCRKLDRKMQALRGNNTGIRGREINRNMTLNCRNDTMKMTNSASEGRNSSEDKNEASSSRFRCTSRESRVNKDESQCRRSKDDNQDISRNRSRSSSRDSGHSRHSRKSSEDRSKDIDATPRYTSESEN